MTRPAKASRPTRPGPVAPARFAVVRDARTHNLKSLAARVPLGQLTAVVGVSGSGKSSFAFDTLYAEGQRRYAESFSTYARQFLARLERPDAVVEGVPPAIAIDRRPAVSSSRSTVATLAQLLEPLRVLYATVGELRCDCGRVVEPDDASQAARRLVAQGPDARFAIAFPLAPTKAAAWESVQSDLRARGFLRVVQGEAIVPLEEVSAKRAARGLDVVVDRLKGDAPVRRIQDSLEQAYREGRGRASAHVIGSSRAGGPCSVCRAGSTARSAT